MKKTLLFTALAFIVILGVNAQTTIWNLGGDPTVATNGAPAFPLSAGIGTGDGTTGNPAFPVVINGLSITGISTNVNMGAVNASVKPFTDANNVTYSFANRFQNNGGGYAGATDVDATPTVNMPTQRYLSFKVTGNSKIYIIGISGSSSSARKIFVTNGSTLIGSVSFPAATVLNDGTVNYTGPATTIYLFSNASINLTYLSATNYVATSVSSIISDRGVSFNGTEILNTNGLSLEVYSVLGKKVASSTTTIPTANFQKGVYIVRVSGTNDSLKICI